MAKKSRLRVQKKRKGRWLISVAFLSLFGLVGWGIQSGGAFRDNVSEIFQFSAEKKDKNNAVRGAIYDRNFKELATSLEKVSVYAIVREIKDTKKVALKIAAVLGKDPEEIISKLKRDSHRVWLAKNIDQEEEDAIRSLDIPGIMLHSEVSRYYPEHKTASHIVGFSDGEVGLAGVEFYFDQLRSGIEIKKNNQEAESIAQVIPSGNDLQNIVLTLDLKIQRILENFVDDLGKTREGLKITACLMEGETGAIVASVSYPSYDPNFFRDYKTGVLENLALDPIVVPRNIRAAFRDAVLVDQSHSVNNQNIPWSVFAPRSSLGAELRMWSPLGLEKPSKVDFGIDVSQTVATNIHESSLETNLPLGSVPTVASPMQILSAFTTLISGGYKVVPYAVERVVDVAGNEIVSLHSNDEKKMVVNSEVSSEISKLMRSQARVGKLDGTYVIGNSTQYKKLKRGRSYSTNQVVLAPIPFENPEIILLLTVQESSFTPYQKTEFRLDGNNLVKSMNEVLPSMAALQQVMKNLSDMMMISKREEMNLPIKKRKTDERTKKLAAVMSGVEFTMPDLKGMSLRKSLRLLNEKNVEVKISGSGVVVRQSPKPGAALVGNSICQIVLDVFDSEMWQ